MKFIVMPNTPKDPNDMLHLQIMAYLMCVSLAEIGNFKLTAFLYGVQPVFRGTCAALLIVYAM